MVGLFRRVDTGETGLHRLDPREGQHHHPPGSAHRGLQEAAPRRPAHRRQRREAGREPLLQLPPLRPRPRRPLQGQQEARRRSPSGWASSCRATERTITREDIAAIVGHLIELNNGLGQRRRHRPPRQPPHPRQRRADPERLPRRPPAHGARGQGAHDDPGDRQGDAQRAHQHPPRRGGHEGVLRRQPALASSWTRPTRWPS